MTEVMFAEYEALVPIEVGAVLFQFAGQVVLQKQLLAQPDRDRHPERCETPRRKREIGFEQALELEKRLVVERDEVDLGRD